MVGLRLCQEAALGLLTGGWSLPTFRPPPLFRAPFLGGGYFNEGGPRAFAPVGFVQLGPSFNLC